MRPLKHLDAARPLLPQSARERLYEWHPGRMRRWQRCAGLERVSARAHVAITLDDGPDEDATPAVLDALDRASAHATFFFLAEQVRRHVSLASEVVRRGHEIALHGYHHLRHDRISSACSRDDVLRGFDALETALGVRCRWYRPPYGRMSEAAAGACVELGMTPVYWSAWGIDWEQNSAARISEIASRRLDDGSILLLHDSARYGRRPTARPTAQAIPLIATRAARLGLSLVSIAEAIQDESAS